MKKSKLVEYDVDHDDDFLYVELQKLLGEIKITQGGTALDSTLRRHQILKKYAIAKQIDMIRHIEETYFCEDGSLNQTSIQEYYRKKSLQN